MTELMLVLAIALVVLGPDRLPGFARAAGRAMREFRKASREIQASLQVEEVRRTLREQDAETRRAQASLGKRPGDEAEVTSSKPPVPLGGVVKAGGPALEKNDDAIGADDDETRSGNDAPDMEEKEDDKRLSAYLDGSDRESSDGEDSGSTETPPTPQDPTKEADDM